MWKGGTIALKIGIVVMVLGVIVLVSGFVVILSAPWDILNLEAYDAISSVGALLGDMFRLLNWGIIVFVALLGNLFLSGTALILAGYTLYRVPAIQKQEDAASSPEPEVINS